MKNKLKYLSPKMLFFDVSIFDVIMASIKDNDFDYIGWDEKDTGWN